VEHAPNTNAWTAPAAEANCKIQQLRASAVQTTPGGEQCVAAMSIPPKPKPQMIRSAG